MTVHAVQADDQAFVHPQTQVEPCFLPIFLLFGLGGEKGARAGAGRTPFVGRPYAGGARPGLPYGAPQGVGRPGFGYGPGPQGPYGPYGAPRFTGRPRGPHGY